MASQAPSPNHISKIALIGATGTLGSQILSALLARSQSQTPGQPQFSITLITRPGSITASQHPELTSDPRITIAEGSYTDHAVLVSTLSSQDALVITLSWSVQHTLEEGLIRAACEARVPYILPCEFGSDSSNPRLLEAIPIQNHKARMRKLVEELGAQGPETRTSSWIGIINNPWYDWSLAGGWFGIDIRKRKVTLFGEDDVKAYMSTVRMSGLTVASLLSLPLLSTSSASGSAAEEEEGQRTLPSYANKMVYVRNFHLSQREILSAVQRATDTTDADWEITRVPTAAYIAEGQERFSGGNPMGIMNILYGNVFVPGVADVYYSFGARGDAAQQPHEARKIDEAELDTVPLGLEGCEDLEAVTARVVREVLDQ